MKTALLVSMVGLALSLMLAACDKPASHAAGAALPETNDGGKAREKHITDPILSNAEVGAVLGHPVTSVEGSATDMNYKTDVLALETTVGVERDNDAAQAILGARKATTLLGGTAEDVPDLGDEAFFGAMSFLYVRKGDVFITITPPNLQQVAGMAAYSKVTDATLGSDEQLKAMQNLVRVEKTDPVAAGLKSRNDVQGALTTVAASSRKQGTAYEAEGRAMALALAAKVLEKL